MLEKKPVIYSGYASLELLDYLAVYQPPPVKFLLKDQGKEYDFVICHGSQDSYRTRERQRNLAEIVREYSNGASIRITGIIVQRTGIEDMQEFGMMEVDKSTYFGTITLITRDKLQMYHYYQDMREKSVTNSTKLTKLEDNVPPLFDIDKLIQHIM